MVLMGRAYSHFEPRSTLTASVNDLTTLVRDGRVKFWLSPDAHRASAFKLEKQLQRFILDGESGHASSAASRWPVAAGADPSGVRPPWCS